MPLDSSATKGRILAAAHAEFSQHGLAGGRVDRIAAAAEANKRLIYVYFGSKEQLFDTVVERCLAAAAAVIPFDPADLPAYALALFDYVTANPNTPRLITWNLLERGKTTDSRVDMYLEMARTLGKAQQAGDVDDAIDPLDLLAFAQAIALLWPVTTPVSLRAASGDPSSEKRFAAHRAAVAEAMRRIVDPQRSA